MAELDEYLYKEIKPKRIKLLNSLKNNCILIYHALIPHSFPKDPAKKIDPDSIKDKDLELIYDSSLEIYKDSKDRIHSLEDKAFNLMTYISAITAILFFLLDKDINSLTKTFALISITILILALLISLRCIGIKTQKTLFINSMFEFGIETPKSRDKKFITVELINNALFNQNIADNTTDLLKASRILLFYGIITAFISFLAYFYAPTESNIEPNKKFELVNSKYIDSLYENTKESFKVNFSSITNKIDSLSNEIDSLKK